MIKIELLSHVIVNLPTVEHMALFESSVRSTTLKHPINSFGCFSYSHYQ